MTTPVLDLVSAREAIITGRLTSQEYVAELIDRKQQWDHLNCLVAFDAQKVRAAAIDRDRVMQRERDSRPLNGLPFVAKDNIDTTDLPTTACTPALRDHHPPQNAPVVARLLEAGAILFGKCNMHELAFGVTNNGGAFGAARNPYDQNLIPGGSSGGTAAAVSAGLVPFGLGSDTGGSVRIPAALCGIVGLRPTLGRYPQDGVVPISPTRDTVGPMARCVADVALVDAVISGQTASIEPVRLSKLRLGVPREYFFENLEPGVARSMEALLHALKSQGTVLIEESIPNIKALDEAVSFVVVNYEARRALEQYLKRSAPSVSFDKLLQQIATPAVKSIYGAIASNELVSEDTYLRAINVDRPALQHAIHDYIKTHRLDGYIVPTCCMTARPIGQDDTVELNGAQVPTFGSFIRNADPSSNAGIPSISIPIGLTDSGLPIGAMIEAQSGSDKRLLAMAQSIERLCGPIPAPTHKAKKA
jgi:mandelamide amidase